MKNVNLEKTINIAIDGPAGAGKSTIAKILAEKLGYLYLDTGAMYRALAYKILSNSISVNDEKKVEEILNSIKISVQYIDGKQKTLVDGIDVSDKIRTNEISKAASDVSRFPCVRNKMVDLQRKIAESNNLVLDGRDITSYVLPDAEFKFFLTAKPEIRADRRFKELLAKGSDISYEKVLQDILQRDKNDSTRKLAPLKITADSKIIDSSDLNIEEVLQIFLSEINKKLNVKVSV